MKTVFKVLAFILGVGMFLAVILELFAPEKKSIAFIIAGAGYGLVFLFYALKKKSNTKRDNLTK